MEAAAEHPVGRGVQGDREVEESVEGPGPPRRWEVQRSGFSNFLSTTEVERRVPVEDNAGSECPEWELRERRGREVEREAEAEELGAEGELGAGEELPLFLPMPSFMAPTDED